MSIIALEIACNHVKEKRFLSRGYIMACNTLDKDKTCPVQTTFFFLSSFYVLIKHMPLPIYQSFSIWTRKIKMTHKQSSFGDVQRIEIF